MYLIRNAEHLQYLNTGCNNEDITCGKITLSTCCCLTFPLNHSLPVRIGLYGYIQNIENPNVSPISAIENQMLTIKL